MNNSVRTLVKASVAVAAVVTTFAGLAAFAAAAPLTAEKTITLPGGAGKFDFAIMDYAKHRLLAAHKGTGMLTVFNLKKQTLKTEVNAGKVQGIVVCSATGKYYAGDEDEQKIVAVDSKTMKILDEIPTRGAVDAMELDTKTGIIYAAHDDNPELWTVDTSTDKITGSVTIGGGPEVIVYDAPTDALYVNIKTTDSVQKIDPATNQVVATWSTLPAEGPHGLVVDSKSGRLFSAGNNGKLVVMDISTGNIISTVDIAPGVDQIAFDPIARRVYCGCGGVISVVAETDAGAQSLGDVTVPKGGKSLNVDPTTHAVWMPYADKDGSYLLKLTANL